MNINLHEAKNFWNLGLVRIVGTMPATKCVILLKERLSTFGLNIEDSIVCLMTDGASVMKKVGKILQINQQLCFAHGIQLAIISVLYNTSASIPTQTQSAELVEVEGNMESLENDELTESSDSESDGDADDSECYFVVDNPSINSDVSIANQTIGPVINKVRKIVMIFKRSPTKNDGGLQKYVKNDFGKNLHLIRDCKTRWSSLLSMLERFDMLKNCIKKALVDVSIDDSIKMADSEYEIVSEIVSILSPIKATVDALCRRDANLVTADIALEFMLIKLKELNTEISRKLFDALASRIKERRTEVSSLAQYLHYGENKTMSIAEAFVSSSNLKNKKIMLDLLTRLNATNLNNPISSSDNVQELSSEEDVFSENNETPNPKTISEQLNEALEKGLLPTSRNAPSKLRESLSSKLLKEMSLFESGGTRGDYLSKIYNYLMTIKPTSVEPERAFSAAGLFCSKIRSRLNDESLDSLSFLRSYFQKIN